MPLFSIDSTTHAEKAAKSNKAEDEPQAFLLFTGQDVDESSARRNELAAKDQAAVAPAQAQSSTGQANRASRLPAPSASKIFAETEDPMAQMARLQRLQEDNPRYIKELMHRGEVLNFLAQHGNLREIQGAVRGFKPGDLLSWFVVNMFKTSMSAGHAHIVEYMLKNGFSVRHVGIQTLFHDYAKEGSGWDLRTCHSLLEAGYDVDTSSRGEYLTPLHVACQFSRLPLVQLFLHHGADVNAVAKGGVTPLKLALAAAAADPRDFKDSKKIVMLLQAKGAKESWRSQAKSDVKPKLESVAEAREEPEYVTMSFNLTGDSDEEDIEVPHPGRAREAQRQAEEASSADTTDGGEDKWSWEKAPEKCSDSAPAPTVSDACYMCLDDKATSQCSKLLCNSCVLFCRALA